jgi:hypothetical protein
MSGSKREKTFIGLIIIAVIFFLSSLYLYYLYYPDLDNKKFLKEYGWELSGNRRSEGESVYLSDDFLESDITLMKISASEKIGLNPSKYRENEIVRYHYLLKQTGLNSSLQAEIWRYKGKIICACISHMELNVRINFWPLDTPHQEIQNELRTAK